MPKQNLNIVFVPGLDDGRYTLLGLLARLWSRGGVAFRPYSVKWRDADSYESKLDGLLRFIDDLSTDGTPIGLVGGSAGGSMVINAFAKRPDLAGVVNVSGRLGIGPGLQPSLEEAARTSSAFEQSVRVCDASQTEFPKRLRSRILILQPGRDPVVPLATMLMEGVAVRRIIGYFHTDGIVLAMLLRRRTIVRFLQG